MAGILYAEYDNKLSSMNSNSSFKMIIVSVLVFLIFSGAGITLKEMILGRYYETNYNIHYLLVPLLRW